MSVDWEGLSEKCQSCKFALVDSDKEPCNTCFDNTSPYALWEPNNLPPGISTCENPKCEFCYHHDDNSTRAVKHDDGKPRLDLLDPYAMEQMGLVLAYGAKKYDDAHNWRKGLGYCRLIAAALRHVFAVLRGEDLDPETSLPHPAHATCCLMFLLAMTKIHPEMDDRWKR